MTVPGQAEPLVILYDGVCHFCAAVVRFVVKRDRHGRFRFAALQSETGRRIMEKHGLQAGRLDTFVLAAGDRCWTRSAAALRVCRRLDGLWPLAYAGIVIPRFIRDGLYSAVARNRYRWFGKADACLMPSPELRKRFLE